MIIVYRNCEMDLLATEGSPEDFSRGDLYWAAYDPDDYEIISGTGGEWDEQIAVMKNAIDGHLEAHGGEIGALRKPV